MYYIHIYTYKYSVAHMNACAHIEVSSRRSSTSSTSICSICICCMTIIVIIVIIVFIIRRRRQRRNRDSRSSSIDIKNSIQEAKTLRCSSRHPANTAANSVSRLLLTTKHYCNYHCYSFPAPLTPIPTLSPPLLPAATTGSSGLAPTSHSGVRAPS